MWAHYADGHKGVCLVYKRDDLNSAVVAASSTLKVKSGAVNYDPWADNAQVKNRMHAEDSIAKLDPSSLAEWALTEIESKASALFFTKHDDWASEDEYRWVLFGSHSGDFLADLTAVPPVAILVGSLADEDDIKRVSKTASNLGIPACIMMWSDGKANYPWPLPKENDGASASSFWKYRRGQLQLRGLG